MLIGAIVVIAALSILLSLAIGVLFLAIPLFLMGFIGFLLWRAKKRSDILLGQEAGTRVPTTEEASADPVADSGVADAARSQADGRTRAP